MHEQRQTRRHKHQRQHDGKPHLHAALAAAFLARLAGAFRFQQRLVGGRGGGVVVLREINAVGAFRLFIGQGIDAVTQVAFCLLYTSRCV